MSSSDLVDYLLQSSITYTAGFSWKDKENRFNIIDFYFNTIALAFQGFWDVTLVLCVFRLNAMALQLAQKNLMFWTEDTNFKFLGYRKNKTLSSM